MAWYGNSKGHAAAGKIGGRKQSRKSPQNFANNLQRAAKAGKKGSKVRWENVRTMRALDATEEGLTT